MLRDRVPGTGEQEFPSEFLARKTGIKPEFDKKDANEDENSGSGQQSDAVRDGIAEIKVSQSAPSSRETIARGGDQADSSHLKAAVLGDSDICPLRPPEGCANPSRRT